MTKADLESVLDAVTAKAKGLRDAGVTALTVGEIQISLAPADPPETVDDDEEENVPRRALDDPMTFARRKVPGRQRVGVADER